MPQLNGRIPNNPDEVWFHQHPRRQCHIRDAYPGEAEVEFRALGPHDTARRRVLLWKLPADSPIGAGQVAAVPMLAFSDETISDDDATLLPILNRLMLDAQETDRRQHPELYRRQ